MSKIYDISINSISGKPIDFTAFKGKWLLVVNTASKCGLTPQLKALEALNKAFANKIVVIGCPSNDFGEQEPLQGQEISSFCEINYGVSFLLTEKLHVKGPLQHPFYQWLTNERLNKRKSSRVWWNFQKYLISPQGELVDYFLPITKPNHAKITRYFS